MTLKNTISRTVPKEAKEVLKMRRKYGDPLLPLSKIVCRACLVVVDALLPLQRPCRVVLVVVHVGSRAAVFQIAADGREQPRAVTIT